LPAWCIASPVSRAAPRVASAAERPASAMAPEVELIGAVVMGVVVVVVPDG